MALRLSRRFSQNILILPSTNGLGKKCVFVKKKKISSIRSFMYLGHWCDEYCDFISVKLIRFNPSKSRS